MPTTESAHCNPVLCRNMLTTMAMIRPNSPIAMNEPIAERLRFVV